jgi:crotonobetainyl-CoA:carnitine CoA-transferase CaiB-like acyl-CoA transferase
VDGHILGFGPLYRLYAAADGWVFVAAPQQDEWLRLAGALPGDWTADGRFSTPEARRAHQDELGAALEAAFLTRSAAQWERVLTELDVACAVVADGPPETTIMAPGGLGRSLDLVVDLEHPVCGEYPRMKPLASLSRSRGIAAGAPLLGADTDRVLRELGYGDEQILDLHTKGVVGS